MKPSAAKIQSVTGQAIELRDSDKTVSYSGTPEEVELQCDALAQLDKKTESQKKMLGLGAVGALLVIIGGFFTESLVLGGIGAAGIVFIGIMFSVVRNDDIEDRKLELARWIVDTLRPELKANRPLQLDLDFRGYDNRRTDGTWLTLAMTLEDSVGLRFSVSTHFKRKTRSKRKYTKIKDKLHERVSLTFVAPKGKSFDPSVQERFQSFPVPKLQLRSVKVTPKAATVVYATQAMQRVRGRNGWSNAGLHSLVEGSMSLAAIIASYRALSVAPPGGA